MAERNAPHSLNRESADQIRNQQRGGDANPPDAERDGGPEGNATLRRAWDEPGGDAYAYQQAMTNEENRDGDHRSSPLPKLPKPRGISATPACRPTTRMRPLRPSSAPRP